MKKYRLLLLLLLLGTGASNYLPAQYGLQTGLLRSHAFSQSFNPANLSFAEFEKFQVGVHGAYWFGNVHAPLEGVFTNGNVITDAAAAQIVSELDEGEVVNAGFALDLANVAVKLGERKWSFRIRESLTATASFDNPKTLGLALRGNGPYLGDTITDEGMQGLAYQVRAYGAGTSFELGEKVKLGVRLNLLQGLRLLGLDQARYSLYTSENGTQVDLSAEYAFRQTEKFGGAGLFPFQGFGASVDAGVVVGLNEKLQLEGALNNLGALVWTTDKKSRTIELDNYEGLVVQNIFQDSLQPLIDAEVDSLENLITPDSVRESYAMATPVQIRAGLSYFVGENGQLSGTIIYSPIRASAYTPLPLLSVAYQHEVIEGLTLGAQVYGGGYDTFGAGAMGNYRFDAGPVKIDLLLGFDNLLGWIAPSMGRGFSFFGGVGVQM